MPDRYIRDELLTSERWWGVSDGAARLFVSCMLLADDAARLSAAPMFLCLRAMAGTADQARLAELIRELSTVDLVRPYSVDGRPYLFIPRFKQRKRYMAGSKNPAPPIEINDMENKSQTQDRPKPDSSQPEVGPKSDSSLRAGAGVGVGVGVSSSTRGFSSTAARVAKAVPKPGGGKPAKVNGSPGWWKTDAGIMARAVELGVAPNAGETYAALKARLFEIVKRH